MLFKNDEEQLLHLYGVTRVCFKYRSHVVEGLNIRNRIEILEIDKNSGFNATRLSFCAASVKPRTFPAPRTINYTVNRDLIGLNSVTIMEKIVAKVAELDLYIPL